MPPSHKMFHFAGPQKFYLLGRSESARHQGFASGKTLGSVGGQRAQFALSKAWMKSHSFSTPSVGMAL